MQALNTITITTLERELENAKQYAASHPSDLVAKTLVRQKEKALKEFMKREKRNRNRREQNAILRDLCGTSARAAREDMGL